MPTRIILENGKHLNVKDGASFPIEKALSDIRDITKRRGGFSRSLKLVGDDNNIEVLGYLFDVNVVDSDFDINKKTECIVEQNGVQVFIGYFQLRKVVNISKSHTTDEDAIEFEGLVFDYASDFFSKIKKKQVEDLRISDADDIHTLNYTNIVDSYSHTVTDKYVYPTYHKPQYYANGQYYNQNVYQVRDFKPAIFMKVIWDAIHDEAGFSYTWSDLTSNDVRFDKLITPFNSKYEASEQEVIENGVDIGTDLNPDPDESSPAVESFGALSFGDYCGVDSSGNARFYNGTLPGTIISNPAPAQVSPIDISTIVNAGMQTITNENRDDNSLYNTGNGFFIPLLEGEYDVEFEIDYKFIINAPSAGTVDISGTSPTQNYLGLACYPYVRKLPLTQSSGMFNMYEAPTAAMTLELEDGEALISGNNNYTGSYKSSMVVDLSPDDGEYLDIFGLSFRLYQNYDLNNAPNSLTARFIDNSSNFMNCEISMEIESINVKILPRVTYQEGLTIDIDRFLPRKWSQSQFIKDVMTMYNLMAIPDENDPNNIIYKRRDVFYDEGEDKDFREYLIQDRDKVIQFLPDLNSKFYRLGYSPDEDKYNKAYQDTLGRTFGDMLIEFQSEFTEGKEDRLLTASPTPVGTMAAFGGYAPYIDTNEPSMNPRILYWLGSITTDYVNIQERDGTIQAPGEYGGAHHSDSFTDPSIDFNFGVAQFYFYPEYKPTLNNLFNLHYRRLVNNINKGKLMTAWFALDELKVSNLKLSDKIYVDNSWWYINKFTFDGNNAKVCKMELIQIDDGQSIKPARQAGTLEPVKPFPGGWGNDNNGGQQNDNYGSIGAELSRNLDAGNQYNTYGGNNANTRATGENNIFQNGVKNALILGDNNQANSSNTMIVGNNVNAASPGIHANNIYVYNDIIFPNKTASVTDTLRKYVTVLDKSDINSLHTTPITISRGDLELEGVTAPIYIYRVECIVDVDGTNFTGGADFADVTIDQDSGSPTTIIDGLRADTKVVTDGINSSTVCADSNEIEITSDLDPGGGGTNSTIKITIFYKLMGVDTTPAVSS